jgi:hypothetical protein
MSKISTKQRYVQLLNWLTTINPPKKRVNHGIKRIIRK